ncbi:GDSL-type esterase/lipase family protein [Brevundimonas bacteroides]|uniref:GDSL-type esterase/lipase family protein n=1 Tax=Brevundimonas bacteroides TaxID=74311 RepID=UPI000495E263|nr:GDSL-type esterase/lipase family protein [Brevundimonas bacteroides]
MIRALVVAAACATADGATAQERPWTPLPDPVSATCPRGLCQAEALQSFFTALDGRAPVRVLQFGDSHTAGGVITASLLWRLQSQFPGRDIRLDAHGVVGATLRGLESYSPLFDGPTPDLIVLAYGTNEGFDDLLDPAAYEGRLRQQIERVRQAAPSASLLILGAPEAMRGEGGGRCPEDPEGRWRAPDMLAVVRDVQHRVAAEMGVAFWDWRGRMGGDCSAHALTLGPEPLMRLDHVHFTGAGGDWIGGLLFEDLMAAHTRRGGR